MIILFEVGVYIERPLFISKNYVYYIQHNHLENSLHIEFELKEHASVLWVFVANSCLLGYLLWKFVLELLNTPDLKLIFLEFVLLLNFFSLILLGVNYIHKFGRMLRVKGQASGLAELTGLYDDQAKIYSRYFLHGCFLVLKVCELLASTPQYRVLVALVRSFLRVAPRLLKCWLSVFWSSFFSGCSLKRTFTGWCWFLSTRSWSSSASFSDSRISWVRFVWGL